MKKNIAIVAGGDSSEIVVSLKSAQFIYSQIDSEKYNKYIVLIEKNSWTVDIEPGEKAYIDKNDFSFSYVNEKIIFDFAYITIHGTPGEDGRLEAYFDLIGIPHSTCDVFVSALTFNKFACNRYLQSFKEDVQDINIAKSILLYSSRPVNADMIIERTGLPCFVKPNSSGSSFGISKVKTKEDLLPAIKNAFKESKEVIVEQFIKGTEVTCGCYKTDTKEVVLPLTEVVTNNEFFDFDAKYNGESQEITPARIPRELSDRIQRLTSDIYDILGCKGIIRIDYIISGSRIFLLEVNTTPGMTPASFLPQQVRAAGLNIQDVFTEIIEDSLSKK